MATAPPQISYPPELPVSARREDLLAAIGDHQVVVVAGETGSGKTTQLPKICLELGRGVAIDRHTQPRRIAARTVARADRRRARRRARRARSATRCASTTARGQDTLVRLMTDGLLLAEIQRDRLLRRYDTIIVDEAHERSLNIDFLLGYLHWLLPRRPDLKVIITSATIDPAPLRRALRRRAGRRGLRPHVSRSRSATAPPSRRRPTRSTRSATPSRSCCARRPGDVLVFLSGEREIRDTAEALRRAARGGVEILPLYARLSPAEQQRVFAPPRRRAASCSPRTSPRRR